MGCRRAKSCRVRATPSSTSAPPYARNRVRDTGMTATEVVEDALRGYVPPVTSESVEGLVRRGPVLVKPAQGRHVTHHEADQALQVVRERDL